MRKTNLRTVRKPNRSRTRVQSKEIELELFVSGMTPKSIRAIEVLNDICETHFSDGYTLRIVDIYREPLKAKQNSVFAVPTLIKHHPGPRKIFIGDMSDAVPVLRAFGIQSGGKK